ncbi:MAG: hypothetical protein ACK5V0_04370, partial [Alphaproteobacteria bacterium]
AQTMPGEKRHRARTKPESGIGTQPPGTPSWHGKGGGTGFAEDCIPWHDTPPWVIQIVEKQSMVVLRKNQQYFLV